MVTLNNIYIEEDFGDGSFSGRTGSEEFFFEHPRGTQYAGDYLKSQFRPEWTDISGQPSSGDGFIRFSTGTPSQYIFTPSEFKYGRWFTTFRYDQEPSDGVHLFSIATVNPQTTDGRIYIDNNHGGTDGPELKLSRHINGSFSEMILSSPSFRPTSFGTMSVSRNVQNGFELFASNVSRGTTVDSYFPEPLKGIGMESIVNQPMDVDSVEVR